MQCSLHYGKILRLYPGLEEEWDYLLKFAWLLNPKSWQPHGYRLFTSYGTFWSALIPQFAWFKTPKSLQPQPITACQVSYVVHLAVYPLFSRFLLMSWPLTEWVITRPQRTLGSYTYLPSGHTCTGATTHLPLPRLVASRSQSIIKPCRKGASFLRSNILDSIYSMLCKSVFPFDAEIVRNFLP